MTPLVLTFLGASLLGAHRIGEAERMLEEACALSGRQGFVAARIAAGSYLSGVRVWQNRNTEAIELAQDACRQARQLGFVAHHAVAARFLARAMMTTRAVSARKLIEEGLELARACDARPEQEALLALAAACGSMEVSLIKRESTGILLLPMITHGSEQMATNMDGYSGDDFVKYGKDGLFPAVLEYLNGKFVPAELARTKGIWDDYVAGMGGDPNQHAFGKFAAVLMKDLFAAGASKGADFPTREEWIRDSTVYNGQTIDAEALKAMAAALRDNLQTAKPLPMVFSVAASKTGKHYVQSASAAVAGTPGISVTMFCPADQG
jgi:hypothetical protein